MQTINVEDDTKRRFLESMAVQIGILKRKLSASEFVDILLDLWEKQK